MVGHALDEGTQIGPVVDERQLAQALDYVKLAESEGCERVCGGERLTRRTEGITSRRALFVRSRERHAGQSRGDVLSDCLRDRSRQL